MMVTKSSVQRFTNTLDIETIRAVKWVQYFGMRRIHPRLINCLLLDQLDRCRDDASRRIILGISQ